MAITDTYPPRLFTLVPMSRLSKRHFDLHPIWSEHYDDEEREQIVSWGVDREWLGRELDRVHDGSDHCAYPILRPYPLPDRMRLYVKVRFVTAGGARLDGYVMNDDAFVVTLFSGDAEYTFSRYSAPGDLNDQPLRELKAALRRADDPVFPLRYETDFLGPDDAPRRPRTPGKPNTALDRRHDSKAPAPAKRVTPLTPAGSLTIILRDFD